MTAKRVTLFPAVLDITRCDIQPIMYSGFVQAIAATVASAQASSAAALVLEHSTIFAAGKCIANHLRHCERA